MVKLNRNKYFTGKKKLKNVKMFEEFLNEAKSAPITFSLDLVDIEEIGDKFKIDVEEVAKKHNSVMTKFNSQDGLNYEAYFSSPDEKSAFAIVDELYGPEDESRESNKFYVYGEENESLIEAAQKFWMGTVPKKDDFGQEITDEFIDGKTTQGPWGFMTPDSWEEHGIGKLGTGLGQKYKKQENGKWLKIEG
jgi:hypothetical protein